MSSTPNSSKRSPKSDSPEAEYNSETDGISSSGDSTNGKRLKKDDSKINVTAESEVSEALDCMDQGNKSQQLNDIDKVNSGNGSQQENTISIGTSSSNEFEQGESSSVHVENKKESLQNSIEKVCFLSDSDDSDNEDSDDDLSNDESSGVKKRKKEKQKNFDPTPSTPFPQHKWHVTKSIINREYGFSSKFAPELFKRSCYGSLHMVQRLELMYKMRKHDGCVNALNFNPSGTKLASGSDDLHVVIWDWFISTPILEYRSGHHANVFQAKFMPLSNDLYIVTCARDGQIRIGELSTSGVCKGTRKLAQHKGSANKLSILSDTPHCFLTCGEDAAVFGIDLRLEKHNKLLLCKSKDKKVPLYTIFTNPYKSHEFAVGGRSQFVKLYDSRYLSSSDAALKDFCPEHLVSDEKVNVTSVVFNYDGQEILASYNDEDIYTFDVNSNDPLKSSHRFRGHRNNQTVKGVNYFGTKGEYIVSGSDCGCIFFWEKESEHIVNYMYADEAGAVNCLEPNPVMPIIATSGLDDDIKIWVPSNEVSPDLNGLKMHISKNMKDRELDSERAYPDTFVDQTIWFLMQHLSRPRRRRLGEHPNGREEVSDDSSTASSDEMDISSVPAAPQCNQS